MMSLKKFIAFTTVLISSLSLVVNAHYFDF